MRRCTSASTHQIQIGNGWIRTSLEARLCIGKGGGWWNGDISEWEGCTYREGWSWHEWLRPYLILLNSPASHEAAWICTGAFTGPIGVAAAWQMERGNKSSYSKRAAHFLWLPWNEIVTPHKVVWICTLESLINISNCLHVLEVNRSICFNERKMIFKKYTRSIYFYFCKHIGALTEVCDKRNITTPSRI